MQTLEDYFRAAVAEINITDPNAVSAGRAVFFAGACSLMALLKLAIRSGEGSTSVRSRVEAEIDAAMREEWPGYAGAMDVWKLRN